MIRLDGNIPELDEIRDMVFITARLPDRDLYFHAVIGKFYPSSGYTITKIVWNKNWLLEKGVSRWEVWGKKKDGIERMWKFYDNLSCSGSNDAE